MGKSAPSAPPPPDPYATARAQTSSNVSTAVANTVLGNADETGPLGSVRYQQKGSYRLGEPVLNSDGSPRTSRRWVADPGSNSTGYVPRSTPVDPGAVAGNATGDNYANLAPYGMEEGGGGGRWVEDAEMSYRDIPQWERITTLSPAEQAKYDKTNQVQQQFLDIANQQAGRLETSLGTPLSFDDIPDDSRTVLAKILGGAAGEIRRQLPTQDYSADRQRVENALYERLNPQLDRDRAALENQLVNQGFTRSTEAFRNELDSANRQANDARLGVIAAGGQEQSRLRGLDFQSFALENDAQNQSFNQLMAQLQATSTNRERQIQERMALRNAPINEISALLGQSQVNMPQFTPYQAGTIAGTPVGDYVYKSADIAQKNYQAELQANAATTGGLFELGSTALGGLFKLSDRRAKTGIVSAGTLRNGLPVYVYRYHGDDEDQLGLMADEVEALHPEAVREIGGFKHVNYELAGL
jgi:hypothetical protein